VCCEKNGSFQGHQTSQRKEITHFVIFVGLNGLSSRAAKARLHLDRAVRVCCGVVASSAVFFEAKFVSLGFFHFCKKAPQFLCRIARFNDRCFMQISCDEFLLEAWRYYTFIAFTLAVSG